MPRDRKPRTDKVTMRPTIGPHAGREIEVEYPLKFDNLARLKGIAELQEQLRGQMLEEMHAARANGASFREIADAVGMSHTGVAKWLKRPDSL